jgi:hypothetical protein
MNPAYDSGHIREWTPRSRQELEGGGERVSAVFIYKRDGEYRITKSGANHVSAPTLEMALILAIQNAGIQGVELAPTLQAAEVLESLLGANE